MHKFDVVIVGNGILGLTLAYFLKKKDPRVSVALIGNHQRIGCATLAAGAMLNLWCELTDGQFENQALAERFNLTKQGIDAWEGFAAELSDLSGEKIEVKWGTYLLRTLHSTQIEDRSFNYIKKSLKRFNIKHKELFQEDLPWLKPSQCSRLIEALWVPDGSVDSRQVVKALDLSLSRLGVHLFDQKALKLSCSSSKMFSSTNYVELEDNTKIVGENIVLANGAYAQRLIDQDPSLRKSMPRLLFGIGAGIDITFPKWVHEYGGMGREIFALNEVVRTTDRGGACGVHVVPYGNGKFYAGSSSLVSLDDDPEPKMHGIHVLLHSLIYEIHRTFFSAGIGLRGNGFRPTSADTFPLIGKTKHKGIWLLNGTKRDGFSMSPYVSKQLASAILGEDVNLPQIFSPCRNLLSYKTKEKAIDETELMYIGADYQHGGLQVPYMVDKYNAMRRNEIVSFYEKRSLHNFGIHPELIHLYENDKFYEYINHSRDSEQRSISPSDKIFELLNDQKKLVSS